MAGRLYRMAKVVSANPKSWGIIDANEISGFKRVAKLSDLYSIAECILSSSYGDGVTDGADAVGQIWHVSETDSDYKLTNWASRKSAAGWTKLFYGGLDTTVYKVLGTNEALPTTGIKSCIYLKLIEAGNPTGDNNKYAEYVYTGDIAGTYDATKWEKLGEITANIDLSEYYKKTEVYNKAEINEKTSKRDVQILNLNAKVDDNAINTFTAEPHTAARPDDEHKDQYRLNISLNNGVNKTAYIKPASSLGSGVMTYAQKVKLDGIAVGANNYVHPDYTPATKGLYKITVDSLGHVSNTEAVTKEDIAELGISGGALTVDAAMSETSTNAVQNKVIDNAIKTHSVSQSNFKNVTSKTPSRLLFYSELTDGINHKYLKGEGFVVKYGASDIPNVYYTKDGTSNDAKLLYNTDITALTDTELNEILK